MLAEQAAAERYLQEITTMVSNPDEWLRQNVIDDAARKLYATKVRETLAKLVTQGKVSPEKPGEVENILQLYQRGDDSWRDSAEIWLLALTEEVERLRVERATNG
tara:strand:+ start:334 stop:648 length:315 start_codon:yes stop_codon:yes gene_type:complete